MFIHSKDPAILNKAAIITQLHFSVNDSGILYLLTYLSMIYLSTYQFKTFPTIIFLPKTKTYLGLKERKFKL